MIDQEQLNILACAWIRSTKRKLQKIKTGYQIAVWSEKAHHQLLVMHEEDPEKYEKRKAQLEDNIKERSTCIEVLNLILEKYK